MVAVPTVLLRHELPVGGHHHDWLIADPRDEGGTGPLWAARVGPPSAAWAALEAWELEPLPPHRRLYLTYEGAISGGRGSVVRVDEGVATPSVWTDERIVLDLVLRGCRGRVELTRIRHNRWRARWVRGKEEARSQEV